MKARVAGFVGGLAVAGLLALGCSGGGASTRGSGGEKVKGDRTRVSTSEGVEPTWIQECPVHTESVLPFCGRASRKASEKMAYTEAYADALGQLRRFIGQKVEARLEPDGQGGYRFQMSSADDKPVTLRGVWEGERWCEVYDGSDGRTHDCYVMLTYPKLEFDKLLHQAHEIAAQRMQKAVDLHRQGKELAGHGRHGEAAELFNRSKALLSQLKEPQVVDGLSSEVLAEQIAADLRTSAKAAKEAEGTALVVTGLTIEGKLTTSGRLLGKAQNMIQKWVVGQGLKIRPGGLDRGQVEAILAGDKSAAQEAAAAKGAGLLMVVDLKCDHGSEIYGQYFSHAEGGLRLIRTADGRELYTTELPRLKEGHISRPKANEKAVLVLLKKNVMPAVQAAVAKTR